MATAIEERYRKQSKAWRLEERARTRHADRGYDVCWREQYQSNGVSEYGEEAPTEARDQHAPGCCNCRGQQESIEASEGRPFAVKEANIDRDQDAREYQPMFVVRGPKIANPIAGLHSLVIKPEPVQHVVSRNPDRCSFHEVEKPAAG